MEVKTNFKMVSIINTIAGNHPTASWDDLTNQKDIIEEEFIELRDAVDLNDVEQMCDASADLLVTTYGMLFRAGFDANAVMTEVCGSLFTRFDNTEEDALKTIEKYNNLGIITVTHLLTHEGVNYYVTKSSSDQIGNDGKKYPKGKFLKSYKFRTPDLDKFMNKEILHRLGRKSLLA